MVGIIEAGEVIRPSEISEDGSCKLETEYGARADCFCGFLGMKKIGVWLERIESSDIKVSKGRAGRWKRGFWMIEEKVVLTPASAVCVLGAMGFREAGRVVTGRATTLTFTRGADYLPGTPLP